MKRTLTALVLFGTLSLAVSSCKKDHGDDHEHDHEAITKIELHFTKVGSTTTQVFSWTDLDGDGGNAPVIDNITLQAGSVYNVAIELFDSEGHDLTHDIEDLEAEHHRFYYTAGAGITINGLDKDPNNVTLGLKSVWTTSTAATGNVTITLRHYQNDNKEESDLVNNAKSTTDAEIQFQVTVN